MSASFGYAYGYNTEGNNDYAGTGIDPTTMDFALRGAVLKGLYNFDLAPDFDCNMTTPGNVTLKHGFSPIEVETIQYVSSMDYLGSGLAVKSAPPI
jgi:hypothetical protein